MFKKFLVNFGLKTAGKELKEYTQQVSLLTTEERGIHLAYACLILPSLIEESTIDVEKIINTKEDIYGDELSDLVLQTNRLLKDYNRAGEMQGVAGTKIWNEVFRCLIYPELTHYGQEIWACLSNAQKEAGEHLDTLEEMFQQKGKNENVLKVKNARKYLSLIPKRFKDVSIITTGQSDDILRSSAYITLIGLGDFGNKLLNKKRKELTSKNQLYGYLNDSVNFISINQIHDIEKITKNSPNNEGIFIIIGDFLKDVEILENIQQKLIGKFVVYILNDYPEKETHLSRAAVIKTRNESEALLALGLIPEAITIQGITRVDFSDFEKLMKDKGVFNLITKKISASHTNDSNEFNDFLPTINNIYFTVYGSSTMGFSEINEISDSISKKIKDVGFFVFNALTIDERYESERLIVAIWN